MGDVNNDPKGQAQVLHLTSGDYILGDWGIEAKEINDLYRSILGIGRNGRTIVHQLHELCEQFDKPFLVVYNTELKPYFHGRRPSAKQISDERKKMMAIIKSLGWRDFKENLTRIGIKTNMNYDNAPSCRWFNLRGMCKGKCWRYDGSIS